MRSISISQKNCSSYLNNKVYKIQNKKAKGENEPFRRSSVKLYHKIRCCTHLLHFHKPICCFHQWSSLTKTKRQHQAFSSLISKWWFIPFRDRFRCTRSPCVGAHNYAGVYSLLYCFGFKVFSVKPSVPLTKSMHCS